MFSSEVVGDDAAAPRWHQPTVPPFPTSAMRFFSVVHLQPELRRYHLFFSRDPAYKSGNITAPCACPGGFWPIGSQTVHNVQSTRLLAMTRHRPDCRKREPVSATSEYRRDSMHVRTHSCIRTTLRQSLGVAAKGHLGPWPALGSEALRFYPTNGEN
ncbi:uncharacterized protein B0I36DRAFT_125411 [Microdochium trichocladiopsis]|uniref:Uncharacterized protein n=1 Tax=Microdochium trichocladiopsis TaxID=1682393 RepID=A0A9P9BNW2_9PEZI|nr:uncharacterized protein B0I36DRAFT_125411 [Microdochium trichocladiopsis]KAH7031651.1 hypothetical protein B0I36DRAFT_125411 [Microdochium trichocladiopsis]